MTCAGSMTPRPMGIGKLSLRQHHRRAHCRLCSAPIAYDSLGRPSQTTTTINGTDYTFSASLRRQRPPHQGHLSVRLYRPLQLQALGYSNQLADGVANRSLDPQHARCRAAHHPQTSGNGVVANQSFDPKTGRLLSVGAGRARSGGELTFTYDGLGNRSAAATATANFSETFTYDPLNRLTSAAIIYRRLPGQELRLRRHRQSHYQIRRRHLYLSDPRLGPAACGDRHRRRHHHHDI